MDIAAYSVANSQNSIQTAASMAILKKAMDVDANGIKALVDQLPAVASPAHLGKAIDIKI
ncbi:MAG: putative motility protein [Firmicutes bacterium]|nr:putative motility protein [Bacillota bacterium]